MRIISLAVLKFSQSYIIDDKYFIRFHFLLILFISRICLLVLRPNLARILLGWDGLGLSSYLLVIYYSRAKAYNSGMVTALSNRIGDALILVSIGYIVIFGNWNFYFYMQKEIPIFLGVLLIVAACTKSAQIPFSAWLPAAIAAPTPVSSLVHSSTLVTAGVYLIIRHNSILFINNVSFYLILVGGITIIIASVSALYETDLKKIVALSTLSQLGVIILRLGLGAFVARFFHLLRHAFFKALLFLSTGAIIHRSKDYQDLRIIGRRATALPTTNSFTLVSRFRLIGVPFISAFFSKEIILETILLNNINYRIYIFILIGIFLTAAYRTRFAIFAFARPNHNSFLTFKLEEDSLIIKRIFILLFPAIIGGFWCCLFLWDVLKLRHSTFILKTAVLMFLVLGTIYSMKKNFSSHKNKWKNLNWIIRRMWNLPIIRAQVPIILISPTRRYIHKFFDRGFLKFNTSYLVISPRKLTSLAFSIKFVYKILILIVIWIRIVVLYYLCDIIKKYKIKYA